MGRSISSQRLARVWKVFFFTRGEEMRGVSSLDEVSSHVVQSALGGTLVNSLLRFWGLLHRHRSMRVKRKKEDPKIERVMKLKNVRIKPSSPHSRAMFWAT